MGYNLGAWTVLASPSGLGSPCRKGSPASAGLSLSASGWEKLAASLTGTIGSPKSVSDPQKHHVLRHSSYGGYRPLVDIISQRSNVAATAPKPKSHAASAPLQGRKCVISFLQPSSFS